MSLLDGKPANFTNRAWNDGYDTARRDYHDKINDLKSSLEAERAKVKELTEALEWVFDNVQWNYRKDGYGNSVVFHILNKPNQLPEWVIVAEAGTPLEAIQSAIKSEA